MTDIIQFCEERAASYGAVRKSALTAIALDHAIARMKSDATTIEALQAQVAAKDAALRKAVSFLDTAPLESGTCCCGSPVEGHGYSDGHAPVDDLAYHASNLADDLRAALGQGEG